MKMKNKILNKNFLAFYAAAFIFLLPSFSEAAGLIPCGNPGENPCTLCDFFQMFYVLMKWGMSILFILAGVGIFISGIIYIISAGDPGMMTKAKGYLTMCIIGVVIVLCAWLIVNTVMWVLGGTMTGAWFTLKC